MAILTLALKIAHWKRVADYPISSRNKCSVHFSERNCSYITLYIGAYMIYKRKIFFLRDLFSPAFEGLSLDPRYCVKRRLCVYSSLSRVLLT